MQILEKFMLSRQYTPEKLMDVYRDSILDELKHYNIFEYNLFRQADCVFPEEDVMEMTMEDSVVAERKIRRAGCGFWKKIFCERCGMS